MRSNISYTTKDIFICVIGLYYEIKNIYFCKKHVLICIYLNLNYGIFVSMEQRKL